VRDFAAADGISELELLKKEMKTKAVEFVATGGAIDHQV
jgi:hypothetical protein